jgi:Fe-S cluster assembly protein SufB
VTDIEHLNPGLAGLGRYEYGWSDADSAGATARRGLNEDVVRNISALKNEPQWMLDLRLKSLRLFDRKPMPSWGSDLTGIDFQNIKYFVRSTEKQATTWDELPADIKNTYDRLGIPEAEKQRLIAGVAAQYECLAQDSRVWTADRGLVPIKEIEPGDRVFALDETAGRFVVAPVRAAAQTGTKQTYAVTVGTRTIRATENHPFLVLDDARQAGRQRARYRRMWRTVGELRPGDLVAVPRGLPEVGDVRVFPRRDGFGPSTSNPDLLWLLGYFLGDGNTQSSSRTHRVQFAVVESDRAVRDEIARVVMEQFGLRVIEADDVRVVVNSKALVEWLWNEGLAGTALTKEVPSWVHGLPKAERLAFLGGWVDADGYVGPARSGSVLLTSGSEQLLNQGKALAQLCGLNAAGPYHFSSPHPHDADRLVDGYRLHITGEFEQLDCRNPKRTARFGRRAYHHSFTTAKGTTFRTHVTEHLGFARVSGIAAYGIEPVWDLEVDGPHNFVAEGVIVHNSEVVYHQIREDLEEKGVIFVDTDTGLREHADIFKEYFTSVIPAGDNKFASLNTAVWSGGSFIYVPPGVKVDIPLQAYFRINTENMGQFERTLIIADEGSYVHYVEGCLPAGELVADADGTHRPIETIRVGDRVLTHEGRPARVSAIQVRDYDGPMHTFTPLSPGNAFRVTSEHPLLVVPRADVTVKRAPRHGWLPEVDSSRLIGAQPQWRPAKDVQVGDFLVYPKPRFAPAKTTLPFDFARLAGYYLAEGHTTLTNGAESVVFSFHIDELAYVDELQHIFKELYDVSGSVRLDETKHEARLLVYSKAAYHALRIHCGTGSADKRLSADLIGQDELFLRALVDAYVNGDGSVARRGASKQATWVRAHTVSRVWAMQLQAIMARLGTFATMELRRPGGPGTILGRDVVRRDLWQVQWTERDGEAVGPRQVRDAGDYYLVPVKRREDAAYRAPVFNLDVEAPDSYLAQGFAVHNCTAPIYKSDSLHSAVVEIVVKKDARVRYTTIQNWSNNVYNLVTKRATCAEGATMEWIDGNIGSKVTMKYPAVYLLGRHARGETLSIAFAGEGQHQDAGAKMVHAAPDTSSSIISKSVARGGGRTSYRGLIQIQEGATGSKSTVRCDALLVDTISRSDTYPYVDVREDDVQMGHEATVSKVSEDQLFYLMSRGMTEEEAMAMIVRGFVEPIARELPMEYALELNRLIELQMEGAVG